MECNKEEAIRARGIAEHKMKNDDFEGAKRLALKAQKLFPELENIAQLLAVCNVHHCAKLKLNGSEMDWYGILQLDRSANKSSIKKQYRKLALLLHPDKNKFAGAEAAFKLIGEANAVLADQTKRSLYDMKTASKTPHPSNTASTNVGLSKSSQYDTKPAPKPTPRPSNTTSANADRTRSSQYGTKPAPKSTPPLSNTASANADQTKSSQSETETALKSTPHPSNTTCAYADQTKSSQYDTKTAPNPTPHPLNSTNTSVGSAGRLYEPRNNNKNGYSNFTSSNSYQPTWHQTFWPPCSVYHHHYNLVHRWLTCPSCGSFIGSTNLGPQGCCWRPYGFAGPGPIAKEGSGSRVGDSKEEEMVNVLKKCVEMVNSNTRDLQKNIDMLWSNVRNLKKGVEMPKPNEKKRGRE
ncbi:Chaperone DnaJ [Gossypium australe]|uniref:Chaperone DnaJ n=1 Tax=Gossypium australe TaxID=47621 RepID=A0A5B6VHW4_9ROSI|nr:Chaperone DnaJ [Gossypium australe]